MGKNRDKKQKKKKARIAAARHQANKANKNSTQAYADQILDRLYKDENGIPKVMLDHLPFPCPSCGSSDRFFYEKAAIKDIEYLNQVKESFDSRSHKENYIISECLICKETNIILDSEDDLELTTINI